MGYSFAQMSLAAPIVIFVRPLNAGNIGALCRVMANFSCAELRIVSAKEQHEEPYTMEDWAMATENGKKILDSATKFNSLEEAVHDLHFCVGSSGREQSFPKGYQRELLSPSQAFKRVFTKEPNTKWALVFGPEDSGLNAVENSLCDFLIRVPTEEKSPSMNVAMCAGVLLYHWKYLTELNQERHEPDQKNSHINLASFSDKQKFLNFLKLNLEESEFFKHPDKNNVLARFVKFLQNLDLEQGDLLLAFEVLYQLRCTNKKEYSERNFLSN